MSRESQRGAGTSRTLVKVAISLGLLAVLVWWVGLDQLLEALRTLHPGLAFASFALQFASIAMGGLNVLILVHAVAPTLPKRPVFLAYLRSWVIGAVAPGRLGDLSLAHFLTPLEVTYGLGLAVVVVDKFITFLVTVAIGALGVLLYVGAEQAAVASGMALVVAVGSIALIANRRVRRFVRDRLLGRHGAKFAGFSTYTQGMLVEHPGLLSINTLLTVVRTVVMALSVWVMLLAFHTDVDLVAVVFVQTIAQLAAWVPVSMAGIGVRETTATVLYTQLLGLAAAPVLNANLLTLVLGYLKALVLWVSVGFGGRRPSEVVEEH